MNRQVVACCCCRSRSSRPDIAPKPQKRHTASSHQHSNDPGWPETSASGGGGLPQRAAGGRHTRNTSAPLSTSLYHPSSNSAHMYSGRDHSDLSHPVYASKQRFTDGGGGAMTSSSGGGDVVRGLNGQSSALADSGGSQGSLGSAGEPTATAAPPPPLEQVRTAAGCQRLLQVCPSFQCTVWRYFRRRV